MDTSDQNMDAKLVGLTHNITNLDTYGRRFALNSFSIPNFNPTSHILERINRKFPFSISNKWTVKNQPQNRYLL